MNKWIRETVSNGLGILSTKRQLILLAGVVLCAGTVSIVAACTYYICKTGDIGTGAVAALTAMAGITAGLAGNAYRKPSEGLNAKTAAPARNQMGDIREEANPGNPTEGQ